MATKPQKPSNLFVTNGWYLDLGVLVSPHFETLEGLSRKTGTVDIVDAGTNVRFKFASQIVDFGAITLTRTYDGSLDDSTMRAGVALSISKGVKFSGSLIKNHFGSEVFRIGISGLRFVEENYPAFNVNAEEKLMVAYSCTVDTWILLPTGGIVAETTDQKFPG